MTFEGFLILLFVFASLGWAVQLMVIRSLFLDQKDATENAIDAMSKIAQLGFIHMSAKDAQEAVTATVILENELAAMAKADQKISEELEKPHGKLVGFRASDGHVVKFMTDPPQELIDKIPSERKVYSDAP